jgi:hypothetical protein
LILSWDSSLNVIQLCTISEHHSENSCSMIYCFPPSTYSDIICFAMQRHCTEKSKQVFLEMKLRGIHKSDHVCSVSSKIVPPSLAVFSLPLFALYSAIITPNILTSFGALYAMHQSTTVFCHPFALDSVTILYSFLLAFCTVPILLSSGTELYHPLDIYTSICHNLPSIGQTFYWASVTSCIRYHTKAQYSAGISSIISLHIPVKYIVAIVKTF